MLLLWHTQLNVCALAYYESKKSKEILCNFLVQMLQYFCFDHEKLKKLAWMQKNDNFDAHTEIPILKGVSLILIW